MEKLGDAFENDLKAIKILEKAYPDKRNLDLADAYSDIADAYLGLENIDETQKYLNHAFKILDSMIKKTSEYYYLPCSTLASLLEALQDYENAEHMYLHTAQLMVDLF